MSKKFMRKCALFLVCLMIINTCVSEHINLYAKNVETKVETFYLDGVEFEVTYDENFNLIVEGNALDSASTSNLILNSDGTANIVIENEGCEKEEYSMDVFELDYDNEKFEATVYDDEGDVVEDYEDYDQLMDEIEDYDGQLELTLGGVFLITLALVVESMLLVGTAKMIGEIVCISAKVFVKKVKAMAKAKRKEAYQYYYPAYRSDKYVYVAPKGISCKKAAKRLSNGKCVYAFTASMARKAIIATGYDVSPSVDKHPEGEIHIKAAQNQGKKGYMYLYHYHRKFSDGVHRSDHSFYGVPEFS